MLFKMTRGMDVKALFKIFMAIFLINYLAIPLARLCAGTRETSEHTAKLFPVPDVLKPNINFWKKIYAIYTSEKVLIHDADDLNIIYEVVDFRDLFENPSSVSDRTKWNRIEKIKKQYKKKLFLLAVKLERGQALTAEETRILKLFGDGASPRRIRKAARNLRGQQGMKEKFHEGIQRSGIYYEKISKIFRKHGLPRELIMLPHVESSFYYRAYSKYGAAGIWQFTRTTGRLFLRINYDIDERLDPILATEAAARLLKRNYKELKSWPLAITAYNHGLYGMKRARKKFGNDIGKIVRQYRSRTFGFASRNFYAEFIAALQVAADSDNYFGNIEIHRPESYLIFKTRKYYDIKTILQTFNLTLEEFQTFNPAVRQPVLRGQRRIPKGYILRVPDRPGVNEKSLWASLSSGKGFDTQVYSQWYKVRRGDNLSAIARRHRVSVNALVQYNNLRSAHRIYAGQILKIPGPRRARKPGKEKPAVLLADASAKTSLPAKLPETPVQTTDAVDDNLDPLELSSGLAAPKSEVAPPNTRVEVAAGDNMSLIIVPSEEPAATIPDEPLVQMPQAPVSEWIRVEPEETLGHYAEWLEVPTQRLRNINHLSFSQELRIGQRLRLTFAKVTPEEFMRRRYEYLKSIEEDFFSAYKVDTVKFHRVKRGQSIWTISRGIYDVPLWLLVKYNPDLDLQNLHVGDQIVIPIVSEISPGPMN